jgi:hypothetical protein
LASCEINNNSNNDDDDDDNNNNNNNADLFAETEGFLTAIQDRVVLTRNYKKYILKQPDTV